MVTITITVASVTSSPFVFCLLAGIVRWNCCGVMTKRESAENTNSTTTNPSSTAKVANQLACQLQPEGFECGEWCTAAVALLKDVRVGDCNIKQEVEDVFIKLLALGSAAIIATNLVTPVNSTHELVVVDDRQRARNSYPGTILLPSEYCPTLRLTGGRHNCHNLLVHPGARTDISLLDGKECQRGQESRMG